MFLSLMYFITALLGFLTSTVITMQLRLNRYVNFYLLILFFFVSFRFFFNAVDALIPFAIDENVGVVFRSFVCAVFPCFYLYFKCLISNRKNIVKEDLYHFILPVLFGLTNIFVLKYVSFVHYYFYYFFSGIIVFYLIISFFELKNKLWFCKNKDDNNEQRRCLKNWSILFFFICSLLILRLLITLLLDVYIAGYSEGTRFLWVGALLSCILFFEILQLPEVLFFEDLPNKALVVEENNPLVFEDFWIFSNAVLVIYYHDLRVKERVEDNLLTYIHEIERLALTEFCFRKPGFSLRDFAIRLKIPKDYLTYFFRYHSSLTFLEFKKAVQIYDAICLIEKGYLNLNTVKSLSKTIGFSSYELFLISFEEITGVLPLHYNKKIKKDNGFR